MDNRFADHGPEARHPVGQPPRDPSAMQRQIGASRSLSHRSKVISKIRQNSHTSLFSPRVELRHIIELQCRSASGKGERGNSYVFGRFRV
jgi:hypothetical protein